jgi:hypothetical protein
MGIKARASAVGGNHEPLPFDPKFHGSTIPIFQRMSEANQAFLCA